MRLRRGPTSADRRARVVTARALRPTARAREREEEDETNAQLPSLHDYDEAEYPDDVHDQSLIPRAERAIKAAIIWSAVLVIDKLYEGRSYARFYALETVARVDVLLLPLRAPPVRDARILAQGGLPEGTLRADDERVSPPTHHGEHGRR